MRVHIHACSAGTGGCTRVRERKNVKSFGAGLFQKAGRSPQRAKYHSCISSKISARYFCGKHPTQTGPLRRLCAPQCTKKKKTPLGVFFFLVRKMGLEPTRHRHTHLKRACLPIPALPLVALTARNILAQTPRKSQGFCRKKILQNPCLVKTCWEW